MKKNLINEDIRKMMGLINYDRGKTLTENKESNSRKTNLVEYGPIAALAGEAVIAAAIYKGWQWAVDAWGSKSIDTRITDALDQTTWPKIEKAIKDTEKASGEDIEGKFDVVSASEAKRMADDLNAAFDYTFGTNENKIGDTFADMGSFMDLARVSYEYGDRPDGDLAYELDDELSQSDFKTYVSNIMKSKPLAVFNGKSYNSLEKLLADITEMAEPAEEEKTQEPKGKASVRRIFIKYPCVQDTIDIASEIIYPYKEKDNQVLITLENGDKMLVSTGGKYVAIIGGNKSSGTIECEGDLNLDDEELTLSESRYIFEQTFGSIKLIPKSEVAGNEVTTGTSGPSGTSGLSGSFTRTDVTYADIAAGKGEFKKGDKGEEVKKAQEELNKSNKVNPKLKVDGMFGPKTETAVGQVGGEKVFNKAVIDMLSGQSEATGEATGEAAGEEVTQQEENKLDMVTVEKEKSDAETLKNQVKDLEQAISQQPTKEQCMDLIATAAAGIKKGVRVSDTSTLEQCYNSYNFGKIGDGSKKVKKAYGLKGKGN